MRNCDWNQKEKKACKRKEWKEKIKDPQDCQKSKQTGSFSE